MFWRKNENTSKNPINSDEYERLAKRISDLDSSMRTFKTNIEMFETDLANLRGKFNQRLKGLAPEEKPQEIKTETINKDEFVGIG